MTVGKIFMMTRRRDLGQSFTFRLREYNGDGNTPNLLGSILASDTHIITPSDVGTNFTDQVVEWNLLDVPITAGQIYAVQIDVVPTTIGEVTIHTSGVYSPGSFFTVEFGNANLDAPLALLEANLDAVFGNDGQPNRVCLGDGAGGFTCSDVSSDTNDSLEGMGSSLLLAHVPTSFHICCNWRPHSPRFTIW